MVFWSGVMIGICLGFSIGFVFTATIYGVFFNKSIQKIKGLKAKGEFLSDCRETFEFKFKNAYYTNASEEMMEDALACRKLEKSLIAEILAI